jgi:mannose-6-phosphate isomerase class I
MYQLNCGVQKYGWGRKGNESKVALYKKEQEKSFEIDLNQSYAELWMGKKKKCYIKFISFIFFQSKRLTYTILFN